MAGPYDDELPSFDEIAADDEVGFQPNMPPGQMPDFGNFQGAQMPPGSPMQPLDFLQGIMGQIRVPGEVKERIMPILQMAAQYQAARDAGMAMNEQRARAQQMEAESKQRGVYAEIDKPLPIDAAKMALNKAVGYFAESLAPGRGIKNAEARRAEEIGLLKERRIQRLRTMEQDAQRQMQRAEEMGDQVAKEKSMREAEKLGMQIETVRGGMKDYYEKRDRQEILTQQTQARQDEIRLQFVKSMISGRGTRKLLPEQAAQLKLIDSTMKAKIQGLDNELKTLADDFSMDAKDRDAKKAKLIQDRAQLVQDWMDQSQQVIGTAEPKKEEVSKEAPPADQVIHDVLSNAGDMTPREIQKDFEENPTGFAAAFGIKPEDVKSIAHVKGMLMKSARQIHSVRTKIYNNIRAINNLRETAGGTGGPRADKLMEEIIRLNGELRAAGLPTINGTPGSETETERRARLRFEGKQAEMDRAYSFETPTYLN